MNPVPMNLVRLNLMQMNLAEFDLPAGTFTLRRAAATDVGAIVALLADDQLRASVESTAPEDRRPYELAFEAIARIRHSSWSSPSRPRVTWSGRCS